MVINRQSSPEIPRPTQSFEDTASPQFELWHLKLIFVSSLPFSSDQSSVECETVSLDDSKKFKIININQATSLDGPENKFEHKAHLIEIDKLLINTANGPKHNASSKIGVWHQVRLAFIFLFTSFSLFGEISFFSR